MELNLKWETLESFLLIELKQSRGSIPSHKSRYKILVESLEGKEFNRDSFNQFIYQKQQLGAKPSYLNGYIKLIKILDKYFKTDTFKDYTFFNELLTVEEPLTPQEIEKLATVKQSLLNYRTYKSRKQKIPVLIYLLGHIGSRIEETLSLKWDDLMASPSPMIHFRAETTKTKKERFCSIPKWLLESILDLPREGETIFYQIDKTRFNQDLKKRAQFAGINRRVHAHLFRGSSINNKLKEGLPIQEVSSYHGHQSINTTFKYYTKIQAEQIGEKLSMIDPAFKKDQTYDNLVKVLRNNIEQTLNPLICDYSYKRVTNKQNRIETIFKIVKKI